MKTAVQGFGRVVLLLGLSLSVGIAAAQVSVGDSGTPSYSQAIAVPPGVAGMSPKLSLFYAGGGVNGPLGHGWSVQGLSSITRCPATVAMDGKRAGVTYGPNDKLCLDGQRLIQTDANGVVTPAALYDTSSGKFISLPQTNDAAGSAPGTTPAREFRTEKDIYARIRAYGYANNDTTGASGPAYFRVWTKAGQIYDYGANPNINPGANALIAAPGKPPMAWAAARISDTLGNYIDFKYEQRDIPWGSGPTAGSPTVGHEWNILEIQYSGNKVVFNYDVDGNGNDLRPDKAEAYQMGSKNVSVRRLKSITTYVNSSASALGANGGTAVKTTQLTYEQGTVSGRSRINKIQDCAGGPTSTRCLPASTLQYANGGNDAYQTNAAFSNPSVNTSGLATLDMIGNGTSGVLLGDFNGDGKTDILYWSDTPANNKLYLSNGDGSFTQSGSFNITTNNLFKSDGCYYAIAADFNGDGVTDILRVARSTSPSGAACSADSNLLFLSNGDGSFKPAIALPSNIDLSTVTEVYSSQAVSCIYVQNARPIMLASADSGLDIIVAVVSGGNCYNYSKTIGKNFYLIDVDGDGVLDIVTTINPAYYVNYQAGDVKPTPDQACSTIVCTHVYRGSPAGQFAEATGTNLAHHSVYSDPPSSKANYPRPPSVADVNGDGLQDLFVRTGSWISRGTINGDFDLTRTTGCSIAIDFNGDGRADCLYDSPGNVAGQTLYPGDGSFNGLGPAANFNLNVAGKELSRYVAGTSVQDIGNIIVDINGDGRQDILRWEDDATQNVVYLSNGDGSFTPSNSFNLGSGPFVLAGTQLQKSDGTASVMLGDFTGRGNAELLRLQTLNGTATNILLTKADSTPADQLVSVTSGSGLKTSLYYVPLSNATPSNGISANLGPRYQSDLGNAAFALAGAVDVTMPMYVVATSVSDAGVGTNQLATEMSYRGLKADFSGRGLLGFREVLRQRPGADGTPMTVDTQYVQTHPYLGVAANTSTYQAALNAINASTLLSTTSNVYCDQTSASAASATTNCPVTAKVARPYLYQSTETGQDLNRTALPKLVTVNTFNGSGDPTNIQVTTTGPPPGNPSGNQSWPRSFEHGVGVR
jgi:hypothetical protein